MGSTVQGGLKPVIALGLGLLTAFLLLPPSAGAGEHADDPLLVISGPAVVEEGSIVEDVFVIHGGARIHGRVTGDVAVLSGRVEISGEVDGDVTAAAGQIELVDGAVVGGDVLYGNNDREPQIGPQATVRGTVSHEGWDRAFDALPVLGGAALWLAMTISTLVLGLILVLVFPRAADAIGAQARERLLLVVGVGAATFVAVPIAAGLAAVTLVGIPLALALLFALLPLAVLAYVTSAWTLGRRLMGSREDRVVPFLAGLGILRALALVPVLGWIVWLIAVVLGLGLLVAAAGASRRSGPAGTAVDQPA
jgi:hypothetical protein